MSVGTCRLCLNVAPLHDSHIIPKWVYGRVASGTSTTDPVIIERGSAVLTSRQVREHLLCSDCEQRFGRWEDLVAGLTVQEDMKFPWLSRLRPIVVGPPVTVQSDVGDSSAIDTAAMASFATSVIWRASVSKEFPKTSLERYEDPVRRYLLGLDQDFPANAFLIVYLLDHDARVAAMPKTQRTNLDVTLHWFVTCGARFQLWVGDCPIAVARACFVRNKMVMLKGIPDFREGLNNMVAEAKPKGKLTKMQKSRSQGS